MDSCKLCGQSNDFADSHIIPKSFFLPLGESKQPPELVTDRLGILPKRRPIGEYDRTILCKLCEPKFSVWDDCGKTVLLDAIKTAELIYEEGEHCAYRIRDINIPNFRMFFISVLWRASVSKSDFYRKIDLGPFEAKAKAQILDRSPGEPDDFAVILSKWDKDWLPVMSNPYMIKKDGVNIAVFELLDYKVYIKVDKRPVPDEMGSFALGVSPDVCIFSRDYADSKERSILLSLAPKFYK